MQSAPLPAGLASQTHQGGGARFFRRFGRAVCGVFTGIARAGRKRRRTEPPSSPTPAPDQALEAPIPPRRKRAPCRPRAVPPAPPARSGWIARCFGLDRRRPAWPDRSPWPDGDDTPFTQEAYPQLSPEACAILNTPVEECDPEILRLMLSVLAVHIADSLAMSEADARAMFATLRQRLGGPLGDRPDTAPDVQPDEAPDTAMDAVPDAPPVPPAALPETQAATLPESATIAAVAASAIPPHTAVLPPPGVHRTRPLRHPRRRLVRRGRSALPRFSRHRQRALPSRRLCYAACAGPP